ncbi:NepR family anti-sigma factor [Ensifer sp. BR816]|uniref:NepR family anti-sigma factor n=1 Tax=Rhizobium sp. (strain BR816) TaxID=1057002 RepID=UPI000A2F7814
MLDSGAGNNDANTVVASKLRALYQAVEAEPVPQHFIDLLRRLDEAERAQSEE